MSFILIYYVLVNDSRLEKSKPSASSSTTEAEPTCTKIYYTSRTHSQLSQVLHELRKLTISLSPSSIVSLHSSAGAAGARYNDQDGPPGKRILDDDEEESDSPVIDIRTVSLASRKQLCVNEKLKGKSSDLDEACRQLLSGESQGYALFLKS